MIKLLAIDIDDTTADKNGDISSANIEAIKNLENAGVRVVIATGRSANCLLDTANILGLEHNLHTGVNGAMVVDGTTKEVTPLKLISKDKYKDIITTLREKNEELGAYTDVGVMLENAPNLGIPIRFFHGAENVKEGDVMTMDTSFRVMSYYKDSKHLEYMRSLCPDGLYTTANSGIIDYMPEGVNKFLGVSYILNQYKVNKNEFASIGDQESDIEMFKNSAQSYAVANCDNFAKETADIILPRTNNENAVAYAIYKHILNDEQKLKSI